MAITRKFICTDDTEHDTLEAAILHEATAGPHAIRACVSPGTLDAADLDGATVGKDGDGKVRITMEDGSYLLVLPNAILVHAADDTVSGTYLRDRSV